MGITGLWEILGEGEVCSLADYAARFFEQHRRPLRVAVDEANWRFCNLTPAQVAAIQADEPAANPLEKVILWRLLRGAKLNIQFLFVADGLSRPGKKKRKTPGGHKLDYALIRLTRQLLDQLKVPHHQAPGEAEAECAKLQAEGIVDAVWSDDGDALMFGAGTLIKQHKVHGKIENGMIRVYRAEAILEKHDLDAESLVLFAMLSGGDYDASGLRSCGPKTAALVAKRSNGLARALCHASRPDLDKWRDKQQDTLQQYLKGTKVPSEFPDFKALGNYRNPNVSTPEQLRNLKGLKDGWDKRIDQVKLRVMLREKFNFSTREFNKHIAPILLARALTRATHDRKVDNVSLGIELKRTRAKKDEGENAPAKSERKIMFYPVPLLEIDVSQQPPGEDWSKFAAKDGTPYDPTQKVECEMLESFRRHGLPDGSLEALIDSSNTAKSKRKSNAGSQETGSPTSKRRRVVIGGSDRVGAPSSLVPTTTNDQRIEDEPAAKKRGRPKKDATPSETKKRSRSKKQRDTKIVDSALDPPECANKPPAFRLPTAVLLPWTSAVIDLCDDGSECESEQQSIAVAKPASVVPVPLSLSTITQRNTQHLKEPLVPGQMISPETLPSLRMSSALLQKPVAAALKPQPTGRLHSTMTFIDLT